MVSLSKTWRSEKVGWMVGLNFELVVNSETLRNPKKARVNMASSVLAVSGGM